MLPRIASGLTIPILGPPVRFAVAEFGRRGWSSWAVNLPGTGHRILIPLLAATHAPHIDSGPSGGGGQAGDAREVFHSDIFLFGVVQNDQIHHRKASSAADLVNWLRIVTSHSYDITLSVRCSELHTRSAATLSRSRSSWGG